MTDGDRVLAIETQLVADREETARSDMSWATIIERQRATLIAEFLRHPRRSSGRGAESGGGDVSKHDARPRPGLLRGPTDRERRHSCAHHCRGL